MPTIVSYAYKIFSGQPLLSPDTTDKQQSQAQGQRQSLHRLILLSGEIECARRNRTPLLVANRLGFKENGGPFSLVELKVIQEVITLSVFVVFSLLFFKNETLRLNHFIGFVFLILAVYFIFKK